MTVEGSDWMGGSVLGRHTQGVPGEQNPQLSLGILLVWVFDPAVLKAEVKSISMGYDSGAGSTGIEFGVPERFRLIPWVGEVGDDDVDFFGRLLRMPRSSQRHDPEEHNPHFSSVISSGLSCVCGIWIACAVGSATRLFKQAQSFPIVHVAIASDPGAWRQYWHRTAHVIGPEIVKPART